MKRTILCLLTCLLLATAVWAQAPNFDYPYWLEAPEGIIVQDNYYCIPEFGDWDDDNDLDMMLGVFYSGNIFYYENVSTTVTPEFANHVVLQADGANIAVTYG
ncbi:hypothetical protein KKA00_04665 [bacterium]|nr:hypothetical protein [bacterium]MBU1651488.1 hypothetical protein [bacterium]